MTAFDTHTIARCYKAAGFTDDQVEAMVETAREAATLPDISQLATKSDLVVLKGDLVALKGDVVAVRSDLEASIADAKVQLILAVFAIVGFADSLLFLALKK